MGDTHNLIEMPKNASETWYGDIYENVVNMTKSRDPDDFGWVWQVTLHVEDQ
jgi:hypothetical protein